MVDSDSPILDFYPEEFEIDMNGKKMAWQGVALLPFIDEQRLLEALAPRYPNLTEAEVRRNRWGISALFVADDHPLYPFLQKLYTKRKSNDVSVALYEILVDVTLTIYTSQSSLMST